MVRNDTDAAAVLATALRGECSAGDPTVTAALERLDQALEAIAPALAVEYHGPGVGMDAERSVYRLIIRAHEWRGYGRFDWSLKICDALDNNTWRPTWTIQGAAGRRRPRILAALPALLDGYWAAIEAAGLTPSPEAQRVQPWRDALRSGADGSATSRAPN